MFNVTINPICQLIKEREALNAKRSAWLKEEGPGVLMDKEYRLLCKSINTLSSKINSLRGDIDKNNKGFIA